METVSWLINTVTQAVNWNEQGELEYTIMQHMELWIYCILCKLLVQTTKIEKDISDSACGILFYEARDNNKHQIYHVTSMFCGMRVLQSTEIAQKRSWRILCMTYSLLLGDIG